MFKFQNKGDRLKCRLYVYLFCSIPLFLFNSQIGFAQDFAGTIAAHQTIAVTPESFENHELQIGDQAPNFFFSKIYNFSKNKARLSDFKEKVVILDFWASNCGPCIESFSKLGELQKKFADQLQILLINSNPGDTQAKVKTFFASRKRRTGEELLLPYILQDTTIARFFPHHYIPHYVWLNKNGVVIAITSGSEVNENNIQDCLKNGTVRLTTKTDELNFDDTKPFLIGGNGGNENDFFYRSIFTGYKEKLGSFLGMIQAKGDMISRFYIINYPLLSLFKIAYRSKFDWAKNRFLVDIEDSVKRQLFNSNVSGDKNKICYELITQPVQESELLENIQNDLFRAFQVYVKDEIREVKCYILVANDKIEKTYSKGGTPSVEYRKNSLKKHIKNNPVSALVQIIKNFVSIPLMDETGLLTTIDIEFPYDFHEYDFSQVKKFLHENGFEIQEANREINFVVISDKKE